MTSVASHSLDFDLAQRCLEHDLEAIALLQSRCAKSTLAFLLRTGASPEEADDVLASLWADCLTPGANTLPKLRRYDGTCSLQTWLNTVALNALFTVKRGNARRAHRILPEASLPAETREHHEAIRPPAVGPEIPMLELMREAIEAAFAACPAEDFVLLQLEHCDRLQRGELATIFNSSKPTISRKLEAARLGIAKSTQDFIRSRDPWLDLQWEDFIELCRGATPACFGLSD